MNTLKKFEEDQIQKLIKNKELPSFKPGDTVRVNVRIVDGTAERIQGFEGVVIARRNRGLTSSFLVRKISSGEGVERRFMLYSPMISSIVLIHQGIVRRSKLYYLRERSGKAARIKRKL